MAPRLGWLRFSAAVGGAVLVTAGCAGSPPDPVDPTVTPAPVPSPTPAAQLRVLSAPDEVSRVVANLYVGALNAAGMPAGIRLTATTAAAVAEVPGPDPQLTAVPLLELASILGQPLQPGSADARAEDVVARLQPSAHARNLDVLATAEASDASVAVVTTVFAEAYGVRTLSDLAGDSRPLVVGGSSACPKQPDCLPLLQGYGIPLVRFRAVAGDREILELRRSAIDVALVSGTDPRLERAALTTLTDDRGQTPAANLTVVASTSVTDEARQVISDVQAELTTAELRGLRAALATGTLAPAVVADAWLRLHGLS